LTEFDFKSKIWTLYKFLERSRKKQALNEAQALASTTALDENPNVVHYY
jgi:hypothetical protein